MNNVFVYGSGFMGRGIAQVCAAAGLIVHLWDLELKDVENAIASVAAGLTKRVARGRLDQSEADAIVARILPTIEETAVADADLVIEAVVENMDIKQALFARAESLAKESCILATNTSSLSISTLAANLQRPAQFVGLHFFSPVPANKLVEIVRGFKTNEATVTAAQELVKRIGKTGVLIKDSPGFLINRVMHAFRNECLRCLEEGIASIEDIDTAVKLGLAHPLGPFELNDFAGLDIGYATAQTLYEGFKDPRWKPNLMVKKLVEAGELGRKTGKGWYDYTSGEQKTRDDMHL